MPALASPSDFHGPARCRRATSPDGGPPDMPECHCRRLPQVLVLPIQTVRPLSDKCCGVGIWRGVVVLQLIGDRCRWSPIGLVCRSEVAENRLQVRPAVTTNKGLRMIIFVEDQGVDVEELTLAEAQTALDRSEAELLEAVNSVHGKWLRSVIGEVKDQIEWLLTEQISQTA